MASARGVDFIRGEIRRLPAGHPSRTPHQDPTFGAGGRATAPLPDDGADLGFEGYDFWPSKLDSFSLPGEDERDERVALARVRRAELVKAFVTSPEYRRRFGQP